MMERDTAPLADTSRPDSDLAADAADDEARLFISPEDFYREAVQREDIRRILTALAK